MTTTDKDATSEHRMHTSTPGASCAPNCPYYTDGTTTTDTVVADLARASGALLAFTTPHALASKVLQARAEFGALQDQLNKACRRAGRVLTGPVADALSEICRGLDSLYVELSWQPHQRPTVRETAVAHWSEPGEWYGLDVVPQACLACDRYPCACDLMSVHVD